MSCIRDIEVLLEHHLASESGRRFFTAVVIGRKAVVFSLNFLSDLENPTIIHESREGNLMQGLTPVAKSWCVALPKVVLINFSGNRC
jgi:hypothetical protein